MTHTQGNQSDPSWQLDLGRELMLNEIIIWNRTDKAEYSDRLKNFTVQVLNAQQSVIWEKTIQEAPAPRVKLVPGQVKRRYDSFALSRASLRRYSSSAIL